MPLYGLLRKVNRKLKERRRALAGRILSPVRRIEFVAPPAERVVAMTFDDGPMLLPTSPDVAGGRGLTETLMDILRSYDAHGTFNVVGFTGENYPDEQGALGSHFAGGKRYDHYPDFGRDDMGGVKAAHGVARRLVEEGHELGNHGYRHILFGPSRAVYHSRVHFNTVDDVLYELRSLHELVRRHTGAQMRFGRPAHYVDKIPDGFDAYDAYGAMGYHYLAASLDGGGWLPSSGDYEEDVRVMVAPIEERLAADPESLRGAIIFQKDGYNLSRQTPVASALPRQLELLQNAGYRVVTVSELMRLSAFEDLPVDDPCFRAAMALEAGGYVTGYRNNTFQPERVVTRGELCQMVATRAVAGSVVAFRQKRKTTGFRDLPDRHPYAPAVADAVERGLFPRVGDVFGVDTPVTRVEVGRAAELFHGRMVQVSGTTRRDVTLALAPE